jgi:ABC-type Fe3+/spermidine/putrescine transport system ATPase subunit
MVPFLEVKGLRKAFGEREALQGIDLRVEQGRSLAILGPSGCGKSTLLRIVAGLIQQDAGEVWLDGQRLDGVPANRRGVGFLFQHYSLFPHMSVGRNIEFGLRMRGVPPGEREAKVEELLALMGLEGMAERRPGRLSGGEQQRVALARALAIEPRMLLLDEPFGALDAKIRRRLRRDLKALQRRLGITMVFVTHDQEEAFEVGDRIAVMNAGRIEQVALPRDLYDSPATSFVARFVGNVNVIEMPVEAGATPEEVIVRPEDVLLDRVEEGEGGQGTLANYVFLGPAIEVIVAMDPGDELSSIMSKAEFVGKGLRRGQRLRVAFRAVRTFPREREPERVIVAPTPPPEGGEGATSMTEAPVRMRL